MPATGYTPLSAGLWMNIRSFILPALSIALIEWVVLMRVLRSDMISTLQQDFILMARAKGLPPWKIILTPRPETVLVFHDNDFGAPDRTTHRRSGDR
jgi:ABC-type dipeptide/oligopeptide/nickel transport system permease component